MSFPARFAGRCATCGKPINKGQYITWSRREKGKAYHADCDNPNVVPDPATVSVPTGAVGVPSTAELMASMQKMLETMGYKPGVPVVTEPETTGEDGTEAIATPKTTKKAADKLVANSPWYEVLTALIDGVSKDGSLYRILLIGPPGTGKSTTAIHATDTKHRVTMTEGSGVEDLIGMFQLRDGATVWQDGPVTAAMRNGQPVLIDEVDHHSTEIGSLLYAILDDNPQIMLPTGENVIAQPGYGVIATTNSNVTALPEAILDRFEAVMIAKTPHPAALSGLDKPMTGAVENYFRSLPVDPWNWSGNPTVRRMRAYHRMLPFVNGHSATLAFGKAGAEIESALTTSGRGL
jgi:hypothetical protein